MCILTTYDLILVQTQNYLRELCICLLLLAYSGRRHWYCTERYGFLYYNIRVCHRVGCRVWSHLRNNSEVCDLRWHMWRIACEGCEESYVEDSMCPFVTSAMFRIWNIEDHHIVLGSKTCRKSWTLCGIIWSESQIHTRLLLSVNNDKYFWRRVDFTGEHALPREMVRRWCSLTLFIHVDAMCKAPPRGHYLLTGVPGIAFGLAVQVASLLMTEKPQALYE